MFDRHARLCFTVLSIPALCLVSFWWLHSARVEAQTSPSNKIRDLQEQRLATLRDLVKITTEHYQNGQASSDELWSATRARDEAELVLCPSNAQRIPILERIVKDAKMLEEQNGQLVSNKLLSRTIWLKAKADRLQQEVLLESAKAKALPQDSRKRD